VGMCISLSICVCVCARARSISQRLCSPCRRWWHANRWRDWCTGTGDVEDVSARCGDRPRSRSRHGPRRVSGAVQQSARHRCSYRANSVRPHVRCAHTTRRVRGACVAADCCCGGGCAGAHPPFHLSGAIRRAARWLSVLRARGGANGMMPGSGPGESLPPAAARCSQGVSMTVAVRLVASPSRNSNQIMFGTMEATGKRGSLGGPSGPS
jgi:hypothetical protein